MIFNKLLAGTSMNIKVIYLAGGCFWGVAAYFKRIPHVLEVESGYANGATSNPSYEEVCQGDTHYAETVRVVYDADRLSLANILQYYFRVVDPTTKNKQGNDVGTQYRSGIYYVDEADKDIIQATIAQQQQQYDAPIVVECEPLSRFYRAEEYHQDYLTKNPGGYCHINIHLADVPLPEEK